MKTDILLLKWNITKFIYENEHFIVKIEHYKNSFMKKNILLLKWNITNPNTKMNIY